MSSRQLICVVACLGCPGLALAQLTFEPYASGAYEYNSNIAAVAPGDPANVLLGDPHRDDRIERAIAGATARYLLGRQVFTVSAEGRRFSYDHFARLDHDEYLLDADLAWRLASLFDGKFDLRREQRMAPLNARLSSELALDRETQALGGLNLQINPEWRLETAFSNLDLDSPEIGFPDYGLRENAGDVAIKYQGTASLTFGLDGRRVNGQYRGTPLSPSYQQSSLEGTLSYKRGDQAQFDGALGYTRRENPPLLGGTVSGVTGMLAYTRKLTGKTTIAFGLARAVNSYIVAAATEFDSTASLKIDWQATGKIAISAAYAYTRSTFTGQTVPNTTDGRTDDYQASSLNIDYEMLRWLSLRPYFSYQTRGSNFNVYQYNGAVIGVQLRIQRSP